jgi:hypothetical protein
MMPLSCPGGDRQLAGVAMKRFDAFAKQRSHKMGAWQGALVAAALALPSVVHAGDLFTACTRLDICYCVNSDYRDAISANVDRVRKLIKDNKEQGKAIGYLSVPLSPAGGGSFDLNLKIAREVAQNATARFGARSVWLLNPGDEAGNGMGKASGADFMYMWTQILEGPTGEGEDFNFFYFAGPTDFGKSFKLTGQGDLETLEAWFDQHAAEYPDLKTAIDQNGAAKTKTAFRNYYGLRASVAYSYGSHDEWNIARLINARRRGATDFGIANQLAIFFDGLPQTPGGYESPTTAGDVGRCIK